MNNYKLYVHICPNGKKYYGITKQEPKRRWLGGTGYKSNQYFYRAINKYGWNNIEHIILFDSLTEHEAKELEQYFIQWYDTANPQYGYNISLGGEGGNGCPCSEEQKKKISKANKGRHHTEESRKKISDAQTGKHIHSEEHKNELRNLYSGVNNPMAKTVMCVTTGRIFSTIKEGAEYYNINKNHITECCKGKIKSCGKLNGQKLVWKYINIIEL